MGGVKGERVTQNVWRLVDSAGDLATSALMLQTDLHFDAERGLHRPERTREALAALEREAREVLRQIAIARREVA